VIFALFFEAFDEVRSGRVRVRISCKVQFRASKAMKKLLSWSMSTK
jgi:hypothetical protein